MTFSKFSLIVVMTFGIGALISCNETKETSQASAFEGTAPGLDCISDGADYDDTSLERAADSDAADGKSRAYSSSSEGTPETADCVMPELAN